MPSGADQVLTGILWAAIPVLLLANWAVLIVAAVIGRRARRSLPGPAGPEVAAV